VLLRGENFGAAAQKGLTTDKRWFKRRNYQRLKTDMSSSQGSTYSYAEIIGRPDVNFSIWFCI
jgi:hypothetical protein